MPGSFDVADELAVLVDDRDLRVGVLQIIEHELIVDQSHAVERFLRLRHDLFHLSCLEHVDRYDLAARRTVVGAGNRNVSVVADERVISCSRLSTSGMIGAFSMVRFLK